MLKYNMKMAWLSIRRRPVLNLLMVMAIAIGIGIFTAAITMVYQGSQTDLPHKSDRLFLVQLDSRNLASEPVDNFNKMIDMTYIDTVNVSQIDYPKSQITFGWLTDQLVNVENKNVMPYRGFSFVTNRAFFSIMDIPFLYGSAWSQEQEISGAPVVVITKARNDLLFNGENSVGKQIRLDDKAVTIVGVIDEWHVRYRFYDRTFMKGLSDDAYLPYRYALDANLSRNARFECWDNTSMRYQSSGTEELLASECGWITVWSLLDSKDDLAEFRNVLDDYVDGQRASGRFPREGGHLLTSLDEVMAYVHNKNVDYQFYFIIGSMFMAACIFSAVGIMLANFMSKTREVCIRRALGAKRKVLIGQYISEVAVVGFIGGVLGIFISFGSLHLMKLKMFHSVGFYADIADLDLLFKLDAVMVGTGIFIAIISSILVSITPILRVCQVKVSRNLTME
ncbi:FtsX-like permease family protein [Pseudoalteromonas sp. A22]|uniref:ABC transporter permease n=1 Tax=Pseudoalteromonas TaxID=53246 RepID=UPI001BAAB32D|nr:MULTISPECIES: ABC transporter permease [Pseudoalteromonas]QUI61466.1 FtsX-like permease family protein [Pseudoalteromonas sp. A22]USE71055.1 hypothetical protein CTT31_18280 [Pseudoalteromonas flavipulchra]